MKYFFIAGEPSGDMHAANLVAELKKTDSRFMAQGLGGEMMEQEGVKLVIGLERLSFMGFWEVVKNLRTIRKNFKITKQAILDFKPDVIVLIDYPGFNLRMAKWGKENGFKVAYYILPQVWAWKENRVHRLKKYCDKLIGILPFEKAFYSKYNIDMEFVGHPLLDQIPQHGKLSDTAEYIALLPGSRQQEINRLMRVMLDVAGKFPQEKFIIAGMRKLTSLYPSELPENVKLEWDNTYSVLQNSKAAIVCSGTATLETALLKVPQVVVYKTGFVNAQIVKRVAKVKFASLPNLIAGEKIVEELLQWDCTAEKIGSELNRILEADAEKMYEKLTAKIGEPGAASKAAKIIFSLAE